MRNLNALFIGLGISVLAVIFILGILSAPTERVIMYEGKLLPVSTVEKIIADKIEVENPDLDIDVVIMDAADDE
jgi:hypothetical protein